MLVFGWTIHKYFGPLKICEYNTSNPTLFGVRYCTNKNCMT